MIYTNLCMQYRYDYLHSDWPPDGKLCLLLVVTSGKPGRPAQTSNQLLRFLTCLMRHLKIVNSCVMRYLSFYPFRFLLSLYTEEEVALPWYVSLPTSLQNILSLLYYSVVNLFHLSSTHQPPFRNLSQDRKLK